MRTTTGQRERERESIFSYNQTLKYVSMIMWVLTCVSVRTCYTGWPDFSSSFGDNVKRTSLSRDSKGRSFEVSCNACNGHLGHVFPNRHSETVTQYYIYIYDGFVS